MRLGDNAGAHLLSASFTPAKPECAATLLHNDVLPFYEDHGLRLSAILTDNGPEFCGTLNHPFKLYLRVYLQSRMNTAKKYRVATLTKGNTAMLLGRYKTWWLVEWQGETAYLKNGKYIRFAQE